MTDTALERPMPQAVPQHYAILHDVERLVRAATPLAEQDAVAPALPAELPYWVNDSVWQFPQAIPLALVRPIRTMRVIDGTEWRPAIAIVGGVTLFRSFLFVLFAIGSDLTPTQIFMGTLTSLAGPLAFVAVVAGLLLALGAILRDARPLRALALAALASAPVLARAVLQGVMTPILDHALQPVGLLGFFAPKAPMWLQYTLAPLDAFGIWAAALIVVAIWATVLSARRARPATTPLPAE